MDILLSAPGCSLAPLHFIATMPPSESAPAGSTLPFDCKLTSKENLLSLDWNCM
jgi:hypothetical protein